MNSYISQLVPMIAVLLYSLKHTYTAKRYKIINILQQNIEKLILKSNFNIIVHSVIIVLPVFFTGSSNVVTGETKSFFSVARSVSVHELKHLLTLQKLKFI
jgi:hypothetical protein